MNMMEERLKKFFDELPRIHASIVVQRISSYLPLMKRYPHIAEQEIYRFADYFTTAPHDNYAPALDCLIAIAGTVPQLRSRIVEKLGPALYEYLSYGKEIPGYHKLKELLDIIKLPISEKDEYLRNIARSVITLQQPIILIIGAGFSYDTMPVTNELRPLLIQLLREAGVSSPKTIIQEDDKQAWRIVKENSTRFKDMFSGWCAKMQPAPQHEIVAEMLYGGQISQLISFNWDDLIERAYASKFSEIISKIVNDSSIPDRPSLWKLHGDVEDLSSDWVFPYEDGRLFKSLIESLDQTIDQNCPQYALIVGYGEWEEIIRDQLIRRLEDNIPTVLRVRPNWDENDPSGISETTKCFFERLRIYFEMQSKSQ